ncbi:hypothetical protein [Mycobacterium sp. DL592]|uniref:hypothetical protein n=1 Tax=Mycobacterium sp. DL592 TaxID=2675524 RepID=UPI0014220BF7|nr:hypothetical protein [Mycobacterium sp. DL592]
MRLVVDEGLWSTGPAPAPVPLAAVVELDGAVLSWTVDESRDSPPQITLTDPARADWLWRIVGEAGHRVLAAATQSPPPGHTTEVELAGLELVPGSVDQLRRLALGHWLRRFWPASVPDAIAGLDAAVLDAEIAVATAEADDFFGDATLDSDVAALLAPHAEALRRHVTAGDPRVVELVRRCVDLVDDLGLEAPGWLEVADALDELAGTPAGTRDDYALAAGRGAGSEPATVIARGVTSMAWTAVPGSVFDAADDTVEWIVAAEGGQAVATITTTTLGSGSPAGIPVDLHCNMFRANGVLDADGRASLDLLGDRDEPVTAAQAWDTDWSATSVTIGVAVDEPAQVRDRVRRFARQRLAQSQPDAFLAEILAAESDY